MNENKRMNTDAEDARRELDQAREAHAAATVGQLGAPNDPEAARRVKDAVRGGKAAWKGYQKAATAGLAGQIDAIQPSAFPDVPAAFREE
jgi:hypothetical protein